MRNFEFATVNPGQANKLRTQTSQAQFRYKETPPNIQSKEENHKNEFQAQNVTPAPFYVEVSSILNKREEKNNEKIPDFSLFQLENEEKNEKKPETRNEEAMEKTLNFEPRPLTNKLSRELYKAKSIANSN